MTSVHLHRVRLRARVVTLAMVTAAALAYWAQPSIYLADKLGKPDLETLFPKSFGPWREDTHLRMVLPSPDAQALLNRIYNQTLSRTYIHSNGYRIMLSVAYGGDQSDATRAHLPEVCYPAQGFQITANQVAQLTLVDRQVHVHQLMTQLDARHEPVTYWLVVGDQVAMSRTDQKLVQFRLGLKGLIADGLLVRVSSIDPDMQRGLAFQSSFLTDLVQAFPLAQRGRVFGTTSPSNSNLSSPSNHR